MGKIVAFSGLDGAGKSTQIALLKEDIEKSGKKPVYLWTRGGYTGPFNYIKSVARLLMGTKLPLSGRNESRNKAFRKTWVRNLWLHLAMWDLIVVYGIYIRFLKLLGNIIIADRYLWDTWVDFKLNFAEAKVDKWILWKILNRLTPDPDIGFLLVISVKESLRRSRFKKESFPDTESVLKKRKALYMSLARLHDWHMPDCMQSVEEIHGEIRRRAWESGIEWKG